VAERIGESGIEPRISPRMLRTGAALALLVAIIFFPLEIWYRDPALPQRAVAYLLHVAIAILALVASYLPLGARWADGLALLTVLGMGANALAYFWVTPADPTLVANAITLLLFGGTVVCGWTPRRTALVGTLLAQCFLMVGLATRREAVPQALFVFSLGSLVFATIIAAFCAQIGEGARRGIARRERELAALSNRLMSIQEEERRRLSRELHDGVGQSLTAVVSHLWLIQRRLPAADEGLRTEVSEARGLAAKTLAEIRELSQLLRPSLLDDWGLVPSLESQVKSFRIHHEIDVDFQSDDLPDRLPADVETAVYRIVQEALTNVARHARAKSVRIRLQHEHEALRLEVADDGVGFGVNGDAPPGRGLGLVSIRERVRALGGRITVTSDHGTRLSVVLPLAA
jgi:signal transduction histidine kinase